MLWDLSYVLDTASRIALGQLPYRDFPLVHAPLTFLIQAAIVRLAGRVYFHHVLYVAAVGGLSTVLAWRIIFRSLLGRVQQPFAIALLLATPLAVLGIYCVFPFPSYDCDCACSILVAIYLLQRLSNHPPLLQAAAAGTSAFRFSLSPWLPFFCFWASRPFAGKTLARLILKFALYLPCSRAPPQPSWPRYC